MELHLFRHGETNWNKEHRAQSHDGSELSETGIQQAIALGERIKTIAYDKVFSSSSLRARQTAKLIWPKIKSEIVCLEDFREISLGRWEGSLFKDIEVTDPLSHKHFFLEPHLFSLPGAETFHNLTARAVKSVNTIKEKYPLNKIAVVSHGAFIKAFLTNLEGKSVSQLWEPPFMHNCAHSIVKLPSTGTAQILKYADLEKW